jgi:hypothetical protein
LAFHADVRPGKLRWGKLIQWNILAARQVKTRCALAERVGRPYLPARSRAATPQTVAPSSLLVAANTVWGEDEWELFVSRQRSQPYHQMGVNARGVHIDLRHEGGTQPKWDSGASVFSDTTASDRWRVQIALPLDRLVPDGAQPGQILYFNVLRATNAQSALAWMPTFAGFHEPSRFGEITLQK